MGVSGSCTGDGAEAVAVVACLRCVAEEWRSGLEGC